MNAGKGSIAAAVMLVALVVGLDQFFKWLVERQMDYHQMVGVVPFVSPFRTHNTGMAFSMFDDSGPGLLILLALCVAALVLYLWYRTPADDVLARTGFALIMGGAIGDLIDRVSLGYVIDYILFHTSVWSFAIFNFADAAISTGAGLVILQEIVRSWRTRHAGKPAEPGNDD